MSINRSPQKCSLIPSRHQNILKTYQKQKEEEIEEDLRQKEREEQDYRIFHKTFKNHKTEKPNYESKDYAMRMSESLKRKIVGNKNDLEYAVGAIQDFERSNNYLIKKISNSGNQIPLEVIENIRFALNSAVMISDSLNELIRTVHTQLHHSEVLRNPGLKDIDVLIAAHNQNILHVEKELREMKNRASFMTKKLCEYEPSQIPGLAERSRGSNDEISQCSVNLALMSFRCDSDDFERNSGECRTEFTDINYAMAVNDPYTKEFPEKYEGDSVKTNQTVTSGFFSEEIRDYQSSEDETPPPRASLNHGFQQNRNIEFRPNVNLQTRAQNARGRGAPKRGRGRGRFV